MTSTEQTPTEKLYLQSCATVNRLLEAAHAAAMALPVDSTQRSTLLERLEPFKSGVAAAFYNREEMREQHPRGDELDFDPLDKALESLVANFPHPWDEMASFIISEENPYHRPSDRPGE